MVECIKMNAPNLLKKDRERIKEFLKFLLLEDYYIRYMERVYGTKYKVKTQKIINAFRFLKKERYVDGVFIWGYDEIKEWANLDKRWRAWLLNNEI